jgi:hypothetical protein
MSTATALSVVAVIRAGRFDRMPRPTRYSTIEMPRPEYRARLITTRLGRPRVFRYCKTLNRSAVSETPIPTTVSVQVERSMLPFNRTSLGGSTRQDPEKVLPASSCASGYLRRTTIKSSSVLSCGNAIAGRANVVLLLRRLT